MSEKPIIFSAPMVRALLDGRKTRKKVFCRNGENPLSQEHLVRRLANGLDVAEPGKCWEWQLSKNNHGYGTLTVAGRQRYAHRLAYEFSKGPIPDGFDVMHSCDNPGCINPSHLEAGTRSQNMADCNARGRSRIPAPRMKGESNGSAKLTEKQVHDIRSSLAAGETQRTIADRHGVTQGMVSRIKLGRAWNG